MEAGTAYKMPVENAILSHKISLEDITHQPAIPEQDSTTFKSTAAVEQPPSTSLQTSEQHTLQLIFFRKRDQIAKKEGLSLEKRDTLSAELIIIHSILHTLSAKWHA